MAQFTIKLPDVGEGTAQAELAAWHVNIGDMVAEDQNLADITTDKATVEIPSPVAGKIISLNGAPGDVIAVGSPLIVLETEAIVQEALKANGHDLPPVAVKIEPTKADSVKAAPTSKVLASPAVRERAKDLGIELARVIGTGPGDRVIHKDLDTYLLYQRQGASAPTSVGTARQGFEEVKIVGIRRKIAERMQESKRHIPHYAYVEEVDVDALEDLRARLNTQYGPKRPKLSLLPFVMAAMAKVLPDFPQINAHYDDDAGILRQHAAVHIGIATQTSKGLMVPVVTHTEARDLWGMAAEVARLATAARDGSIDRRDLGGSTITITSLGRLGGIVTTPVINRPEVAIVGINKIVERPVVVNGQVVIRKMMNLSSSFDHRIIDGADAAEFIQRLKMLLEQPALLFLN